MSYGYDAAELLAQIKTQQEMLARLTPLNFTKVEVELTLKAMREIYTPEWVNREMRPEVASAIRKLQAVLAQHAAERAARTELVESLTEEERRMILDARAERQRRG